MAGLLPGGRATGAANQVPPDGDGVLFRAGAEAERGRVHFNAGHRREALDHERGQRQIVRVPAGFRSVPYSLQNDKLVGGQFQRFHRAECVAS